VADFDKKKLLRAIWESRRHIAEEKAQRAQQERIARDREIAFAISANFRSFVERAWHQVEPAAKFIANFHVDAICEHLQAVSAGQIRQLLIAVPPGHSKSTIVSVMYHPWVWTREPMKRFLSTSYGGEVNPAKRDAIRSRSLIESHWYQSTFEPKWSFKRDVNQAGYYENNTSGYRYSFTVGSGTGFRGNVQLLDDPIQVMQADNPNALKAVKFWWDNVMENRVFDPMKDSRIIIMQRVNERDLIGEMLERGGWDHLCLPSLFEPERRSVTSIGWQDPRKEKDELLFPQLYPRSILEKYRARGLRFFSSQYQQNPVPDGGAIFKQEWWRFHQPPGANLPPVCLRSSTGAEVYIPPVDLPDSGKDFEEFQSWDCTFKDAKDADNVCGGVLRRIGPRFYLLHMEQRRMDFPATCAAITRVSKDYPEAVAKFVEDKANGPAIISYMSDALGGLIAVNPEGNKVTRANAAAPRVEAGNVYLPHPATAPWVMDFIQSLSAFPNGRHDDDVDMLTQALNRRTSMVFPYAKSEVVAAMPEIKAEWQRFWCGFTDWRGSGFLWMVQQPETKVWYVYGEHKTTRDELALHAQAIIGRGKWIPGVIHTSGEKLDVYAVVREYRRLDVNATPVVELREADVERTAQMLGSGNLKITSGCNGLLAQYASFVRDRHGNLPDLGAHLVYAMIAGVQYGITKAARTPNRTSMSTISREMRSSGGLMGGFH